MPITLHGEFFSPPCIAVLTLAKMLGVEINFNEIQMMKGDHLSEEYHKMNPAHTIPALDDNGYHIWESRAILGYLVHQYGENDNLYPKDPKAKGRVDNMLYFDAATLSSSYATCFNPQVVEGLPPNKSAEKKVGDNLAILDGILATQQFVAGDKLSVADVSIRCSLFTPKAMNFDLDIYANITKWAARFDAAVPFFQEFSADKFKKQQQFIENGLANGGILKLVSLERNADL